MVKLKHGGLSIEVPEDWSDRSNLLLVAPREELSLPTPVAVDQPTEAVAVSFVATESDDPREVLLEQAEQLRALNPDLEVLSDGPFECGLGAGWSNRQRLTVFETPVVQLCVVCIVGSVAVVATASAAETRFARCEEMLTSVLRSLGPAQ